MLLRPTAFAAQEPPTATDRCSAVYDRFGENGLAKVCFGALDSNSGCWSAAGAAILEISATLLAGSDWSGCRVSSEHSWQPYVGSRCLAGLGFSPDLTDDFPQAAEQRRRSTAIFTRFSTAAGARQGSATSQLPASAGSCLVNIPRPTPYYGADRSPRSSGSCQPVCRQA